MCLCSVVEGKAFTEVVAYKGGGTCKAQDTERGEERWKVKPEYTVDVYLSKETHEKEVKVRKMRRL